MDAPVVERLGAAPRAARTRQSHYTPVPVQQPNMPGGLSPSRDVHSAPSYMYYDGMITLSQCLVPVCLSRSQSLRSCVCGAAGSSITQPAGMVREQTISHPLLRQKEKRGREKNG